LIEPLDKKQPGKQILARLMHVCVVDVMRNMMARCSRKREAAPHSGVGQFSMSRIKDRPSEDADRAAPRSGLNRRQFSTMLASVAGLPLINGPDLISGEFLFSTPSGSYPLYDKAASHVLPKDGFQSRIALKDSILKLVEYGVIDRGKFFALYGRRGPQPAEFAEVLSDPSERPIRLTAANATSYVDLLWPVGLATHMAANAESPLYGSPVKYASTEGWTLGREESGVVYFDRFPNPSCLAPSCPGPSCFAIHSFTPVYLGRARPWQVEIVFDEDRRMADLLIRGLKADLALTVGINEPYSPADHVYYTIGRHAGPRSLPAAMIEIRNDEIGDEIGLRSWADRLANILVAATPGLRAGRHAMV
jgi:hypothetical protein